MINKEKVNEILADMKEEERKKQEAIEEEVDKFLEGRLEYYVAMIIGEIIIDEIRLLHILSKDGCKCCLIASSKINQALEELDWYLCMRNREFEFCYMHISNAPINISQPTNVENRQIELGLRLDMKKKMKIFEKWIEDGTYKQSVSTEEINEKQKTTNNSPKIILVVIIISLILLFAFLK